MRSVPSQARGSSTSHQDQLSGPTKEFPNSRQGDTRAPRPEPMHEKTQGSPDTQNAPDRVPSPKRRPSSSRYNPRQLELPVELPPCRRRNRIRGLMSLAERLDRAIGLIAISDTVSLAELVFFEWKLSLAVNQLRQRLEAERARVAEARRSDLQTH